jgi:hypothetical protein
MRRIALAGALTAALSLALAGGAGGHKLDSDVAKTLTEGWAERSCAQSADCVRFAGRYCYPLSLHKRRCTAQTIHRLEDGDLVQCQTSLFWVLPRDAKKPRLARVGETRCD